MLSRSSVDSSSEFKLSDQLKPDVALTHPKCQLWSCSSVHPSCHYFHPNRRHCLRSTAQCLASLPRLNHFTVPVDVSRESTVVRSTMYQHGHDMISRYKKAYIQYKELVCGSCSRAFPTLILFPRFLISHFFISVSHFSFPRSYF